MIEKRYTNQKCTWRDPPARAGGTFRSHRKSRVSQLVTRPTIQCNTSKSAHASATHVRSLNSRRKTGEQSPKNHRNHRLTKKISSYIFLSLYMGGESIAQVNRRDSSATTTNARTQRASQEQVCYCCTSLDRNIVTVFYPHYSPNGDYIPGQTGI